jgi:hypothetical protein
MTERTKSVPMVSEGTSHWLVPDEAAGIEDLLDAGVPQGVVERASCTDSPRRARDQDHES